MQYESNRLKLRKKLK